MIDLSSIATTAASGGIIGGMILFVLKSSYKRIVDGLEANTKAIHTLEVKFAGTSGSQEGKEKLLWNEIQSLKERNVLLESKVDRAWEVVHKFAPKRPSDLIDEMGSK